MPPGSKYEENTNTAIKMRSASAEKAIWAIGGGKGGVGKSFVSSSIGISLAQMGHTVTIIDLDLGGANLHTFLGTEIPKMSLSDYLSKRVQKLSDVTFESGIKNLKFISGANDALDVVEVSAEQKRLLISEIKKIDSEFILIDLGAGTSQHTLDFFLLAQKSIVTILPEPTSIENAYRFIKSAFYRKLQLISGSPEIKKIIDMAMDHKNELGIRTPSDLISHVLKVSPHHAQKFQNEMANFQLNLIINQVRTKSDIDVGWSIQSVCQRYFGLETHFIGYLDHDNAAWQSLRKKRPLLLEYPYCMLVGQVFKITKGLIDPKKWRGVI